MKRKAAVQANHPSVQSLSPEVNHLNEYNQLINYNPVFIPRRTIRLKLKRRHDFPSAWFKDKGGKYNHFSLHVYGENAGGMCLKCRVLYDDTREEAFPKKDTPLLTFSKDTTLFLNADGYCEIKCRIEEVSKNHKVLTENENEKDKKDKQPARKFVIEVSIDPEDEEIDFIAHPVVSPSIEVLSKITDNNLEKYAIKKLEKQQQLQLQLRSKVALSFAAAAAVSNGSPLPVLQHIKGEIMKLGQRERVGKDTVAKFMKVVMPLLDELIVGTEEEAMIPKEEATFCADSSNNKSDIFPAALPSPPHDSEFMDEVFEEDDSLDCELNDTFGHVSTMKPRSTVQTTPHLPYVHQLSLQHSVQSAGSLMGPMQLSDQYYEEIPTFPVKRARQNAQAAQPCAGQQVSMQPRGVLLGPPGSYREHSLYTPGLDAAIAPIDPMTFCNNS